MNDELARGRFEGEVIARLDSIAKLLETTQEVSEGHEIRIRGLEEGMTQMKVYAVSAGLVGAFLVSRAGDLITWALTHVWPTTGPR